MGEERKQDVPAAPASVPVGSAATERPPSTTPITAGYHPAQIGIRKVPPSTVPLQESCPPPSPKE